MARLRSSLADHTSSPFGPLDALRSVRLCRAAWQQLGLLAVYADDPLLNWEQRAFIAQIGARKFGPRNSNQEGTPAEPLLPEAERVEL